MNRWVIPLRLGTWTVTVLLVPMFVVFGGGWGLFFGFVLAVLGLALPMASGRPMTREQEIDLLMAQEMERRR